MHPTSLTWSASMHFQEDNGGLDLSSTEMYQRDNFFHFLAYWARFAFLSVVELPKYCFTKGRYFLFGKVVTGMVRHQSHLSSSAVQN